MGRHRARDLADDTRAILADDLDCRRAQRCPRLGVRAFRHLDSEARFQAFQGSYQRIALLVDRIEAQREAVIRPLSRLFSGHPFITSATFAGDGQVVFVLDSSRLPALARRTAAAKPDVQPESRSLIAGTSKAAATVLWADDSISVRKLAGLFLNAEGWSAETAVDGMDALEKLRSGHFQVVVTDLEMPRLHGYELLQEIRADPELSGLPVVVCSSRSSEKHRRRAREAGARR